MLAIIMKQPDLKQQHLGFNVQQHSKHVLVATSLFEFEQSILSAGVERLAFRVLTR